MQNENSKFLLKILPECAVKPSALAVGSVNAQTYWSFINKHLTKGRSRRVITQKINEVSMGKYLNDFKKEHDNIGLYPFDEPLNLRKKTDRERKKICDEYGFDVRETYNMDTSFVYWLYERLKYFIDRGGQTVDFTYHHFKVDGVELNQEQCINRMIKDCESLMLAKTFADKKTQEKYDNIKNDLFKIFSIVFWAMWW